MGKITRNTVIETIEEVEIPEGFEMCPFCKGAAYQSAYDKGTRSLAHEPGLAVKLPCSMCGGHGYVDSLFARAWRGE